MSLNVGTGSTKYTAGQDTTLVNAGPSTLYVNGTSDVLNGLPVPASGVFTVNAGAILYMGTASGVATVGQLPDGVDYNTNVTTVIGSVTVSGGSVSIVGTVPITGTVGISGPVAISGPVSISGTVPISGSVGVSGPVSISSITAGTVDLTVATQTGVANEISISGAPPIDKETHLQLQQSLGPGGSFNMGAYDISTVNSVTIFVDGATIGTTGNTQVRVNIYSAVSISVPQASEQVGQFSIEVPAKCQGYLTFPALGNSMILNVIVGGSAAVDITISGGTRTVSKTAYYLQAPTAQTSWTITDNQNNDWNAIANVTGGTTLSGIASTKAGQVQIACSPGAAGTMTVTCAATGSELSSLTLASGVYTKDTFFAPRDGVKVNIHNTGATANFGVAVTSID